MKVVLVSNYNSETVEERLVFEDLHPWIANWVVTEMRRQADADGPYWPCVMEDSYVLWRGMEELV